MKKSRPFGVTLLAILAFLGAAVGFYHALQLFGLLPISGPFGGIQFFVPNINWLAGAMWVILALIYIWVGRMLWNLDPQGWLFVVVLSSLNLILDVTHILGSSTIESLLPSIFINGIILIYGLLPGTKAAFGADR